MSEKQIDPSAIKMLRLMELYYYYQRLDEEDKAKILDMICEMDIQHQHEMESYVGDEKIIRFPQVVEKVGGPMCKENPALPEIRKERDRMIVRFGNTELIQTAESITCRMVNRCHQGSEQADGLRES